MAPTISAPVVRLHRWPANAAHGRCCGAGCGKLGRGASGTARNFGGQGAEIWCEGGEVGFIRRMVAESVGFAGQVGWFTTLVSSSESLPALHRAMRQAGARQVRTVPMAQGQKRSRFVAWSFTTHD